MRAQAAPGVWWFIPFANLVQPFRILRDLRENLASGPVGAGLVLGWWLAFLGTGILSYVALGMPYNTLEDIVAVGVVSVVTDILFIVEFLLALRLFGAIQRDAEARAATLAHASAEAAPAS